MEFFKRTDPIAFMSQSMRFGVLSLILVVASWVIVVLQGLNYGIDFAGGTLIQVKYDGKAPLEEVRSLMNGSEQFNGAQVNYFGSEDEIVIKTKTSSKVVGDDVSDEAKKVLSSSGNFEIRRVDMVGPKIGSELREKGLMAMLLAIMGILAYVSFRFEWRFGLASVIALVHDVSITLGVLSLARVEINLDILAALLTLLGYSLNDTIIVFDRIREGLEKLKNLDLTAIINTSVTLTLSRTTLTSLTTFFVVLSLYLFGGEIIKGFSFTLLVGIIVGTYSSIFIASPLLIWLKLSAREYQAREAKKLQREKEKERMRAMYEKGTL
jgi:preprotein translocase subunit SecF